MIQIVFKVHIYQIYDVTDYHKVRQLSWHFETFETRVRGFYDKGYFPTENHILGIFIPVTAGASTSNI